MRDYERSPERLVCDGVLLAIPGNWGEETPFRGVVGGEVAHEVARARLLRTLVPYTLGLAS
jgi:hypothetical protein